MRKGEHTSVVDLTRELGFGSLAMAEMSMKSLSGSLKWLLFLTSPLLLGYETLD
jgi:hypothetical protein